MTTLGLGIVNQPVLEKRNEWILREDPEGKSSYDDLPYESHPFPQSHPDRLATLWRLFVLLSTPVTRCRVLELDCASGGNLIPMTFHLPGIAVFAYGRTFSVLTPHGGVDKLQFRINWIWR